MYVGCTIALIDLPLSHILISFLVYDVINIVLCVFIYKVFTKVPKCVVEQLIKLCAYSHNQLRSAQYDFVIERYHNSLNQSFLEYNGVNQCNNLPINIKILANLCQIKYLHKAYFSNI